MEEVVSKLTKLKALLDAGAISREDFDREKARLLSGGPQRLSALSGPVQRRSVLNARWLWIVIPVAAVLAVALVLLLRSRTSPAPASASAMEDDFTQDQSLSKGLWVTRGAVPGVFKARAGSRLTALSSAGLSFSADKGLEMIGAVGSGQLIGFRSTTSFDVPLSIKADVMPSGSGDFFGLMLADATVTKGLAIGGRLSSADGPGTIEYATPRPGPDWASRGTLLNSPQKNIWYTLSIFLNESGNALLKVQQGSETIGQASVHDSGSHFYVVLFQDGSGEPASPLGHTHWRSISVLSGGGLAGVAGNSTAVASSLLRWPRRPKIPTPSRRTLGIT